MAIGLEIEIAVPADGLTAADIVNIRADIAQANAAGGLNPQNTAAGMRVRALTETPGQGRINQRPARAAANGFRIDIDHDDRVRTPNAWPPFEGGKDSLIEIVMDPPAETLAAFDTAMNNIQAWITTMLAQTNNLTTRWANGLAANRSVGPLTFPAGGGHAALGPRPRRQNHNLKGSIQVNIGIDLREYHSMLKWFANSRYARSRNDPDLAAQAAYRAGKQAMRDAVNLGRTLTAGYLAALPAPQRAQVGNFRGLRGWITHMALYLQRGTLPHNPGGTAKNLAPALLKSPISVAAQYGFTPQESLYFTGNSAAIADDILNAVGRGAQAGQAHNAVLIFASDPVAHLDELTDIAQNNVPLTGGPILNPTGVGPLRTGNLAVQGMPQVAAPNIGGGPNTRGGVVTEFRNIPGLYDGVAQWRQLGRRFFEEAERHNRRNGLTT